MLEHLGSDGDPGWVYFRQFGEWELLFNLDNDRRLVPKLIGNLERRGLVETRRASAGMQVRMTDAGRKHCKAEEARLAAFALEYHILPLDDLPCPSDAKK
ncbi:hypothetical protein Pla100_47100 [Neorhodopirellula pilleata]|uniref:HTH marR-type domain-containing protein n=2 Tax=Neorhodopirellula pilleata TaxID=2714738 RepID=A0A5C5ZX38_9BACT|nr:hypothetical protein Pla100_47100 [Neorhodopirellula pilleata]